MPLSELDPEPRHLKEITIGRLMKATPDSKHLFKFLVAARAPSQPITSWARARGYTEPLVLVRIWLCLVLPVAPMQCDPSTFSVVGLVASLVQRAPLSIQRHIN